MKAILKRLQVVGVACAILALSWTPSQVTAQAGAIKVAPEVMEKRCVKMVSPIYPQIAKQARVAGAVMVHVLISKTGNVTPLDIVSGTPLLQDAAKSTVRKWEYKPYVANGQPVAVSTEARVIFKLDAPEGVVTHPN